MRSFLAAVCTIVIGQNMFGANATRFLPVTAFIGGLLATVLLYTIATRNGRTYTATMLLGGVAITGGAGSIPGVVLAALIMGLVTFGLGLLNVPGIVMSIFIGGLLISVIAIPKLLAKLR